ncbi:MAG: hypothetical protein OXF88_15980 [Rhodobacteraceae bacterium]|nr:hypothetical protein [Paracoccaceae bacterium]
MAEPAIAFDTLRTAENLKSAGMEERHAKAIATAMRDAVISGTATRADLTEFKGEIKSEFAEFKGEITSEFAEFKGEITSEFAEFKNQVTSEFAELRGEFAEFKSETKAEFAAVRSEMKAEIASMKVWLMTTTIAVGGIIIAAVALF